MAPSFSSSGLLDTLSAEVSLLREGDLGRLGRLITAVDAVRGQPEAPPLDAVRRLLAQLALSEGAAFETLRGLLAEAVAALPPSPAPGDASGPAPQPEPAPAPQPLESGGSGGAGARGPHAQPATAGGAVDRELFLEFVEESLSHLQSIELNILKLETEPGNRAIVDEIFRPFHTIKGVAGFLGLQLIHVVCHEMENLLDQARHGKLRISGAISDLVLETVDFLKSMIPMCRSAAEPTAALLPFKGRVQAMVERIVQANRQGLAAPAGSDPEPAAGSPPAADRPLGEILVGNRAATPEQVHQAVAAQRDQARPLGEILIAEQHVPVVEVAHALRQQQTSRAPHPQAAPAAAPSAGPAALAAEGGAAGSTENVRVRIALLDQLMTLAGELVLGRNQLLQKLAGVVDGVQGLNSILQHVDRVTSELQEAVMQTRMQPLGGLFSRFHRVVRDLARQLGKDIDLSIGGEGVELDKTLIEALTDPLTHLIRNCADHGIENPATRAALGKPAAGTIFLHAYHEGGKVHVKVGDDGAGVDLERVREKAIEANLVARDKAQTLSERETLRLLFTPGFSTARQVTGVSGRGVGMDVVLSNIERIGGSVEITTRPGQGTTFLLVLPLTLAIVPALVVSAGAQRFAIPQANLLELVHLDGEDASGAVLQVRGSEVFDLRGEMLPLLRLSRTFRLGEPPGGSGDGQPHADESLSIAVLTSGTKRFGLIVDQVFDTEEIVVKPLSTLLKNVGVYAGATLMGDGRVALILDMAGLARHAELALDDEAAHALAAKAAPVDAVEKQTLLLFNVHPSQQLAVPLSLISRLDTIRTSEIRPTVSGKVLPYRGQLLPLVCPEDHLSLVPPPQERERAHVLVFEIGRRTVGLVVTEIADAIETAVQLDDAAVAQKGFSGMAMVADRPTAFLDIYAVIETAYPHWFAREQEQRSRAIGAQPATILLVEDSAFYRTLEKNYLVEAGFQVVEAADGEEALDVLAQRPVNIVVTDIEMPRLNGFDLAARIRENKPYGHLPIVAVTSLSKDQERERGLKAGIDAYLIKLDREQLLAEIRRLLANKPAAA
ncbi:MAG: chemotaxis protein CheW [Candidatus Lambdaproteobacteria bacterium]|nr:chemotaxis protein CheW [Candidatus Lambdaproteobacteria bacterium]